ncbi:type IV secretion system DNA-binding domain-containing protein [Candidatus Microgenomates bacterium]|nr:type IV secretion system DNA-binding domain-containing protein [Candidatus Microgenomates bacterium]
MDIASIIFDIVRLLLYALIIAGWFWGFLLLANAYKKRRKRFWLVKQEYTTLLVQVPRNNEKGPLSAQLMFASIHGIYKSAKERLSEGSFQEHISFEIVSMSKYIKFYVYVPTHLKDFIEGQIYSQYPTVEMREVDDYTLARRSEGMHFVGTELALVKNDYYPIKTFVNFEVDPLAGITGVLSQVEEDEQIWAQFLVRPLDDSWQRKAISYVSDLRAGKKSSFAGKGVGGIFSFLGLVLKALSAPPEQGTAAKPVKLAGPVEQAVKAIEDKSTKLGYEVKIRLAFLSDKDPESMKIKIQSIVGAFKQYNSSNLNGFAHKSTHMDDFDFMNKLQTRSFEEPGFVLNIEELASLYHLPTATVETPSIVWAGAKKGEPPAILPLEGVVPSDQLTAFAQTNFRNKVANFGIKLDDRRRHMYIIGQTGTGKSNMMKSMVLDDIREGRGLAVIDPHGEFIDTALDYIPENRIKDVVVINPGDREYSVGFNLLENIDPDRREILASGMMSIFKKIWENVWSARMEYIMKNILLALLETPGSTLLGATKMLVNAEYRRMIVDNITDPVVKEFWIAEFENQLKTNPKFATEAVAPIQNKIGQFIAVPSIRNIIGQPKSTIDIKEIMDNKKILLVKISKGEIGDDNMALLGAMLITKIQLTAMERSGTREEEMQDFYLYVDEFQNFATSSFATILSEARKYKLNLIIAHQYIAQMTQEVRDAVIGNAGTVVAFRVGPDDAPILKKVFEPVFDENDLLNLSNFHIYIKLMIDNTVNPAFSAITLPYTRNQKPEGNRQAILERSRHNFAINRGVVEQAILTWSQQMAELEESAKKLGKKGKKENREEGETKIIGDIAYREIKDKKGGIWYVRKDKIGDNANTEEGSRGHEGIRDIKIAENEIAEDMILTKSDGSNNRVGEEALTPGQTVEL